MDNLYRDFILEHYREPHNRGRLDPHDLAFVDSNPTCGDELGMTIRLDPSRERIVDVAFDGRGCAISQASASLLTDEIIGKPVQEVAAFGKDDMLDLIGIPLDQNPVRIKCALLALKTLKTGVYGYLGAQLEDEEL